jgi:hypothetical protein
MQLRRTNLPGQLLLVLLEAYVHGRLSTGDRGSAQLSSAQLSTAAEVDRTADSPIHMFRSAPFLIRCSSDRSV